MALDPRLGSLQLKEHKNKLGAMMERNENEKDEGSPSLDAAVECVEQPGVLH